MLLQARAEGLDVGTHKHPQDKRMRMNPHKNNIDASYKWPVGIHAPNSLNLLNFHMNFHFQLKFKELCNGFPPATLYALE